MKINKKNAFALWEEHYGDDVYAEDFHGNLMYKFAYGRRDYFKGRGKYMIYCGWNIHHILPIARGGTSDKVNLLCTNIHTNECAGDKLTFWIDEDQYQVKKIKGKRIYKIVRIELYN